MKKPVLFLLSTIAMSASLNALAHANLTQSLAGAASIGAGTYGLTQLWRTRKLEESFKKKLAKIIASVGLITLGVYTLGKSEKTTKALLPKTDTDGLPARNVVATTAETIMEEDVQPSPHEENITPHQPVHHIIVRNQKPGRPLQKRRPRVIPFKLPKEAQAAPVIENESNIDSVPPETDDKAPATSPAKQSIETTIIKHEETPAPLNVADEPTTLPAEEVLPTQEADALTPPKLTSHKHPSTHYHTPLARRMPEQEPTISPQVETPTSQSTIRTIPLNSFASSSSLASQSPRSAFTASTPRLVAQAPFITPSPHKKNRPLITLGSFAIEGFSEAFGKFLRTTNNKQLVANIFGSTPERNTLPQAPAQTKHMEATAIYEYEIYDEMHAPVTSTLDQNKVNELLNEKRIVSEGQMLTVSRIDRPRIFQIPASCGLPARAYEIALWLRDIFPGRFENQRDLDGLLQQNNCDRELESPRPYPKPRAQRRLNFEDA